MKKKTKAILFLPLAFLALGIINLIVKSSRDGQQTKTTGLIDVAHADIPGVSGCGTGGGASTSCDGGCGGSSSSGGGCCCCV